MRIITILLVAITLFASRFAIASGSAYESGVSDERRQHVLAKIQKRQEKRQLEYYRQLLRVAYQLLDTNDSKSSANVKHLPIVVDCSKTYSEEIQSEVASECVIRGVVPYGVSVDTKIKTGDVLVSINGNLISSHEDISTAINANDNKSAVIEVSRKNGTYKESVLITRFEKRYHFFVGGKSNNISAYTDGKSNIFVSVPMLKFVANDDELAFVLAHEIAHIEKGHYLGKVLTNIVAAVPAVLLQNAIGEDHRVAGAVAAQTTYSLIKSPFSKGQELEADKEAYKLLAEKGFDSDRGAEVIRRMAIEISDSNQDSLVSTHPASIERVKALRSY